MLSDAPAWCSTTTRARRVPTPAEASSAPTDLGGPGPPVLDDPRAVDLFVSDDLRKSATLNTARIAELVAAAL